MGMFSHDEEPSWSDIFSLQKQIMKIREKNTTLEAENTKLKELLEECELWFTGIVGNMNDKNVGEHNKSVPIGNFEYVFKVFSQKIDEALK